VAAYARGRRVRLNRAEAPPWLPELAGRNVAAVLSKPIRAADLKAAVERAAGAIRRPPAG
jgi:hypothetical protein